MIYPYKVKAFGRWYLPGEEVPSEEPSVPVAESTVKEENPVVEETTVKKKPVARKTTTGRKATRK